MKRKGVSGMRFEYKRPGRWYIGGVQKRREPCLLLEMSSAVPVVPLLRSRTTGTIRES